MYGSFSKNSPLIMFVLSTLSTCASVRAITAQSVSVTPSGIVCSLSEPIPASGAANTSTPWLGSIFEKSRTPLQLWFYAIFLFTTSKHGVRSKELKRQLGIT